MLIVLLFNFVSQYNSTKLLLKYLLFYIEFMPLVVAGTNQDLQKYPNQIVLDIIKENFPNPLTVMIFDNEVDLIPFDPITHEGDIRFEVDQYHDNVDYQISVLDDNNQPTKKKISLGRNALFEYIYKPMINIWVRQNSDKRPTEIIDVIKHEIDTIITDNEALQTDNIDSIWCDLPVEFLEREFTTTEEEEVAMQSIWHSKIQTYVKVYKWQVD